MDELELINKLPKLEKREWSYLEKIGVDKRETVIANILGYYFDPNEKHGLGDTFIKALLNTDVMSLTEKKIINMPENIKKYQNRDFNWAKIHIEDSTENNKRIDIVIETEDLMIGIEFKINHHLNNPLDDYEKRIKEYKKKDNYYVVLTPFWKYPTGNAANNKEFYQVILTKFIKNVEKQVDSVKLEQENTQQFFIYKDFINTIENRSKTINMINDYLKLAKEEDKAKSLEDIYSNLNSVKKYLEDKTDNLLKQLNKEFDNSFYILGHSKGMIESVITTKLEENKSLKIRFAPKGRTVEYWQEEPNNRKEIKPKHDIKKYSNRELTYSDIKEIVEVYIPK